MGSSLCVISLTRSVIVHDATHCSKEDSQNECECPCDALSCLFFSALWLQQSQSLLVQEIQSAKNIELTCFKTFPITAATCLQVGPMSLEWPVDPFARFGHSRPLLFPEVPNDDQQRGALPVSTQSRWRQNTLQAPPQVLQRIAGWDGCGPSLPEVCGVLHGIPEVSLDLFSLSRKTGNSSSSTSKSYYQQQHCMPSRSTWQRRVSPGFTGVSSAVQVFWYLLS